MASDLSTVPLTALSVETKEYIANMLNSTKFENENCNSLQRDWRGLTCFLEVINADVMSRIESQKDPTNYILERIKENITMKDFQTRMKLMDRWDIINDTQKMFESDAVKYFEQQQTANSIDQPTEEDILTLDDAYRLTRGLNKAHYDAFLLYADEDADFANEIMQKLQIEYKLKLCYHQSMIAGLPFEHEAMMKLISERCNKLLVILSPNFLRHPINQFLLSYTHALSLDTRRLRKIVPCLYKKCQLEDLPPQLKYISRVDYTRKGYQDFWMLLFYSLLEPNAVIKSSTMSVEQSNMIQQFTEINTLSDKHSEIIQTTKTDKEFQKTDEETDEISIYSLQIENHDIKIYLNNKNEKNKRSLRETVNDLLKLMSWNRKRINQRRKSWTMNPSNTETSSSMPSVPSDNISFSSSSSLSL